MIDPLARMGFQMAALAEGDAMTLPALDPHAFVGRADRWCEVPGCGRPDRNSIHAAPERAYFELPSGAPLCVHEWYVPGCQPCRQRNGFPEPMGSGAGVPPVATAVGADEPFEDLLRAVDAMSQEQLLRFTRLLRDRNARPSETLIIIDDDGEC